MSINSFFNTVSVSLDSGILLIIDLNEKKREKGGDLFVNFTVK
jgi:hypothetical protein